MAEMVAVLLQVAEVEQVVQLADAQVQHLQAVVARESWAPGGGLASRREVAAASVHWRAAAPADAPSAAASLALRVAPALAVSRVLAQRDPRSMQASAAG